MASARKKCIEEVFLNSCRTLDMKKVKACIDLDVDVNCTHDMSYFDAQKKEQEKSRKRRVIWKNKFLFGRKIFFDEDEEEVPNDVSEVLGIRNFALKYAVEQNSEELCDLLLQQPDINIDNRDEDGRNVLMTACKIGKKKMLWILLQGMHD